MHSWIHASTFSVRYPLKSDILIGTIASNNTEEIDGSGVDVLVKVGCTLGCEFKRAKISTFWARNYSWFAFNKSNSWFLCFDYSFKSQVFVKDSVLEFEDRESLVTGGSNDVWSPKVFDLLQWCLVVWKKEMGVLNLLPSLIEPSWHALLLVCKIDIFFLILTLNVIGSVWMWMLVWFCWQILLNALVLDLEIEDVAWLIEVYLFDFLELMCLTCLQTTSHNAKSGHLTVIIWSDTGSIGIGTKVTQRKIPQITNL